MIASPAVTNPDKLLWPDDGLTKMDLINYFRAVSDHLLAELNERLLTLVRAPDGVGGETFFQKNAPRYTPDWIKTIQVPAPSAKRDVRYIVCDSLETLVWIGNQAGIELHASADRTSKPGRPDLVVFDLDPPEGRYDLAAEGALLLRDILLDLGLTPVVKTTGGKGLHVCLRIERRYEFGRVHAFASRIGKRAVSLAESLLTLEFMKAQRGGRVFVDVHRNGQGATLVTPYSPRARRGAPVSFPITWDQVPSISPDEFNIRSALRLLSSAGVTEWRSVLKIRQRLPKGDD